MKIALMTNNYKPFVGGVPISVERLAGGLREEGHQVTVFAPTYEEQTEEADIFRYGVLMKKFIGGIVLPNPFDKRIEQEFAAGAYDVIHVHHPMLIGRTAVYLSKKYHVPIVFTYHTRYEQYLTYLTGIHGLEGFVPAYLNTFLKHCDFIFTPTAGMEEYLKQCCHVREDKMAVLPTGLEPFQYERDEKKIAAIRQKYHAENMPLFLSVSRMSPEKNVEFLLEALQKVREKCDKPFQMLFVGDGKEKELYESKCRNLNLENVVHFIGKVKNEEITPYFQAADAFLFASKTETQGIVILEAFAGGTPVYALKATGVSDLVQSGYNGYLTEENLDTYVEKITDLLCGRDNREQLSQNAYESALEYREEAVARKAACLYNRVIAEKAAASWIGKARMLPAK